jgi:predicted HicB family RNase H-like nuclease
MTGKSKDPKQARITVRIAAKDRDKLQIRALEQHASVGALVRNLIKKGLREKPES